MLKLIVAVADGWAIGKNGDLLARISTDLKRFRELTTGNAVIMGYNTLLSLPGGKPLKNRENIVLYPDELEVCGARVVHSLQEAVSASFEIKDRDVFVIGGGSVYNQMLPFCDTAYITKIDRHYDADTFIPDLDKLPDWYIDEQSEQYYDTDGTPYRYVTYRRKKIITYIGAGMMASALTVPASDNGVEVRLVGTPLDGEIIDRLDKDNFHQTMKRYIPKVRLYKYEETDLALDGVYDVVCGVSSFGVDWFAKDIVPRLKAGTRVLSVTKGLLDCGGGKVMDYPSCFEMHAGPLVSFAAVGGACTSYELADRNQCVVSFCSKDIWVAERFKALLENSYYHVAATDDVAGVEAASALKNAYALAVTIAVGTSHRRDGKNAPEHYNTEAAIFAQSVKEMNGLIRLFGGGESALYTGAGDLYVTVYGGRTRRLGTLLGEGMSYKEAMAALDKVTLESTVISGRMYSVIGDLTEAGVIREDEYPLIRYIGRIINGADPAGIPFERFV